jgi:methionine-S-sulfoxide reductase
MIPGVISTEAGYANGRTENPSYEDVCHNDSGHAETVFVEYDPEKLELSYLLELFFKVIDPTSLNRQGNDVGTQYRTGVYYTDCEDRAVIDAALTRLAVGLALPVAVEVGPLENYYSAEEYHQRYLDKNPGGYCHIGPSRFEDLRRAISTNTSGES